MSNEERLILAKILSKNETVPQIFATIELVEQRPLTNEEREQVKDYIK